MNETALQLPRDAVLGDGTRVRLRLLTRADREAFRAFTTSLTEHDLLFLRSDITDPVVLDGWLETELAAGGIPLS